MADAKAELTDKMTVAVAATVSNPAVDANISALPALITALGPIIDEVVHSTNAEPFYQSRVFWGSLVAIGSIGLSYFKIDFPTAMQGQITDAIMTAIPIAGSLYALYGRFRATKPLGATSKGPTA
jgi:hypothetical protein